MLFLMHFVERLTASPLVVCRRPRMSII